MKPFKVLINIRKIHSGLSRGLALLLISSPLNAFKPASLAPFLEGNSAKGPVVGIFSPNPFTGVLEYVATGYQVTDLKVLTAGHALVKRSPSRLIVCKDFDRFSWVDSVRIHPDFGSHDDHDIGFLHLAEPLPRAELEVTGPESLILTISVHSDQMSSIVHPVEFTSDRTAVPKGDSFLVHGQSGSPAFTRSKEGDLEWQGLYVRQTFSMDRSQPTIYHLARLEAANWSDFESVRAAPGYRSISLLPAEVHLTGHHRFDPEKDLYSASYRVGAETTVCWSSELTPKIVQLLSLSTLERRLVAPETESFKLQKDEILTFIFQHGNPKEMGSIRVWACEAP